MKKATIGKEIFINESPKGDTTTGYLIIKSSEPITLEKIRGKVFIEIRGKLPTYENEIFDLKVADKTELIQNESYKIPFTIDLSYLKDLYQGVNARMFYVLKIKLFVKNSDVEKVEKSLLLKAKKGQKTTQNIIEFHQYFSIKKANVDFKYQIVEETNNFRYVSTGLTSCILILFPFILIFTPPLMVALQLQIYYDFSFMLSILIPCILLTFLVRYYIIYSIRLISMTTFHAQDGFICKIAARKKFDLRTHSLYYTVTHTVIDNRGTTSSIHHQNLFTSNIKQLDNSKAIQDLKFLYPSKRGLQPYDVQNVSVSWNMVIKGRFLIFPIECKCPIKVELIAPF